MSVFRVGQRVKRVADPAPEHGENGLASVTKLPIGATGTVEGLRVLPDRTYVMVRPDDGHWSAWPCYPHTLAPLLDPFAERFIEWVKALDRGPIRELSDSELERVRVVGR